MRDCVRLTPRNVKRLTWLPPTCAYRLVAEGRDLAWWHPLVSGDPETVHTAGVSVRGRVTASEKDVPDDKLEGYIVAGRANGRRGQSASRIECHARKKLARRSRWAKAGQLAGQVAEGAKGRVPKKAKEARGDSRSA